MKAATGVRFGIVLPATMLSLFIVSCEKQVLERELRSGQGMMNPEVKTTISSVADIDGNEYRTVKIGNQWWMAENLKTTKFNDGTSIPRVERDSEWLNTAADHLPAFTWYHNNSANEKKYGALYNWAAAGNAKLCPTGWRLPNGNDIYELSLYIDPEAANGYYSAIAGGALKEKGYKHWKNPNEGATDKFGYTALPGGVRNAEGAFVNLGRTGSWWSDAGLASYNMSSGDPSLSFSEGGNEYGRSVRCIKE